MAAYLPHHVRGRYSTEETDEETQVKTPPRYAAMSELADRKVQCLETLNWHISHPDFVAGTHRGHPCTRR